MGQQLAEAALQLKQHEPEAEDRPVSFLGGVGLEPAPPLLLLAFRTFLTLRTFQLDPELPEEGRQEQRRQAESVRDEELPASHQHRGGRRLR